MLKPSPSSLINEVEIALAVIMKCCLRGCCCLLACQGAHSMTPILEPSWSTCLSTHVWHSSTKLPWGSLFQSAGELILIALIGSKMYRGRNRSEKILGFMMFLPACFSTFFPTLPQEAHYQPISPMQAAFGMSCWKTRYWVWSLHHIAHFSNFATFRNAKIQPVTVLHTLYIIFKLSVVMQATNNSTDSDKRLI